MQVVPQRPWKGWRNRGFLWTWWPPRKDSVLLGECRVDSGAVVPCGIVPPCYEFVAPPSALRVLCRSLVVPGNSVWGLRLIETKDRGAWESRLVVAEAAERNFVCAWLTDEIFVRCIEDSDPSGDWMEVWKVASPSRISLRSRFRIPEMVRPLGCLSLLSGSPVCATR
jgi:hypothetical protein